MSRGIGKRPSLNGDAKRTGDSDHGDSAINEIPDLTNATDGPSRWPRRRLHRSIGTFRT